MMYEAWVEITWGKIFLAPFEMLKIILIYDFNSLHHFSNLKI